MSFLKNGLFGTSFKNEQPKKQEVNTSAVELAKNSAKNRYGQAQKEILNYYRGKGGTEQ